MPQFMTSRPLALICALAPLALAAPAAQADDPVAMRVQVEHPVARAQLARSDGAPAGEVVFTQTPNGVLIEAELTGLPQGEHGFHIHETGDCSPQFSAAGGHMTAGGGESKTGTDVTGILPNETGDEAGTVHGFEREAGPHPGDLPNIHVPESGALHIEVLNARISFDGDNALFDEDGSALIIHSDADDYETQPSGAAGERIACGVIEREM